MAHYFPPRDEVNTPRKSTHACILAHIQNTHHEDSFLTALRSRCGGWYVLHIARDVSLLVYALLYK